MIHHHHLRKSTPFLQVARDPSYTAAWCTGLGAGATEAELVDMLVATVRDPAHDATESMALLLRRHPGLHALPSPGPGGLTALHVAAARGNVPVLNLLLAHQIGQVLRPRFTSSVWGSAAVPWPVFRRGSPEGTGWCALAQRNSGSAACG